MLFIELHIRGECLWRWSLTDFNIEPEGREDPDICFEQRSEAITRLVKLFLETFQLRMEIMLTTIQHYELYLVVPSKMDERAGELLSYSQTETLNQ